MTHKDFIQTSYQRHAAPNKAFVDAAEASKKEQIRKRFREDTVDSWRHKRMYEGLNPILNGYPGASWLTVGDGRFGKDANYIEKNGGKALATDIDDSLLKYAHKNNFIKDFKKENTEHLSFTDNSFDFVFCKESYHHFPRPMIALYEMLRVAKVGVVLIEPQDWIPHPIFRHNIQVFKRILKSVFHVKSIHHDSINYEESGNYIYTISVRELEKVALGLDYSVLAYKGINDVYIEGVEDEKTHKNSRLFKKIKLKIWYQDFLCKLKLRRHKNMVAMIIKKKPKEQLLTNFKKEGYTLIILPKNPYL